MIKLLAEYQLANVKFTIVPGIVGGRKMNRILKHRVSSHHSSKIFDGVCKEWKEKK